MQQPKTNSEFLRALFGEDWKQIPVSTGNNNWGVMPAGGAVDLFMPTMPNYYCVSIFDPGEGRFRRKKEIFKRQNIIVIDDIGTKLDQAAAEFLYPAPTYKIETSPGNYQWGFKIKGGCDDARKAEALIDAIIDDETVNPSLEDPGMKAVTRVVRLPYSANVKDSVKAKNGGKPFLCRMTEWSPQLSYSVEDLALVFGADISEDALSARKAALISSPATAEEIAGDYILKLFRSRGMIADETRSESGFIAVECPWAHDHTDSRTEAGYIPGLRGFQCHHGHCVSRTMEDLRAWASSVETPEERRENAVSAFNEIPEDDPALTAEVERIQTDAEEKQKQIDDAFDRYVYIKGVERIGDTVNRTLHTRQDFNSFALDIAPAGSAGKKSASATFLNGGGRIVEDLDYMPGKAAIAKTEKNGIGLSAFNIWRPGPITPAVVAATNADIQPWLDHVGYIFHDASARTLFLDYWSYLFQNPGRKINWAFVLRGPQGIGKDLMLRPMLECLGLWNVSTIKAKDIESEWTDYLEKQLVIIEELPPFNKKDIYENLKSLVCVAQELVRINKKNVPQYYIANRQNYFIFTNHEDALALEPDDRRFYIFGSFARPMDAGYYTRMARLFKDPKLKASLLRWLLDRDISKFDPMASPPWTDAKRAMAAAARGDVETWIDEQLEDGAFSGRKLIAADELMTAAKSGGAFGTVPFSVSSKITPKKITARFKARGGILLTRFRTSTGTRLSLWALISPELFAEMSPQTLEKLYKEEFSSNSAGVSGA